MTIKMTNHPLMNNINNDIFRQALIGLGLGALAVLSLSFTLDHKVETTSIIFDSELLEVSPLSKTSDETETIASDQLNENSKRYPFFAKHRSPLTTKQVNAIKDNTPRLSIIVNHVGQSRNMTASFLEKLPNDVTIGLSPYLKGHNQIANQFNEYGFETWMDLASLTLQNKSDRGNFALSPVSNFETNIDNLSQQLKNKDRLAGVVLPEQSLITETPQTWESLVFDLFANGYGVLDNTQRITKPALFFHEEKPAPYIKGDTTFNKSISLQDMKDKLSSIRKNVRTQKNLIVTIPISTPATLDFLVEWLNSLTDEGITLIPLSAQAKL